MTDDIRVALVTGGNKGIGLEIARQLAQAGVCVIIGARDNGRARQAMDNLAAQGLAAESVGSTSTTSKASQAPRRRSLRSTAGSISWSTTPASSTPPMDRPPRRRSPRFAGRWRPTSSAHWR